MTAVNDKADKFSRDANQLINEFASVVQRIPGWPEGGGTAMGFHVGQKVECIGKFKTRHGETVPVKGRVYTVRSIEAGLVNCDRTFIHVFEVVNPPMQYTNRFAEASWDSEAFRPITERKTSIEIFERMLIPSDRKMKERV